MLSPTNFSKFWPPYQNFWPPYQIFHPLPFSPNFDPPPTKDFTPTNFPKFWPPTKNFSKQSLPPPPISQIFDPHTNHPHPLTILTPHTSFLKMTPYFWKCVPWRIRQGTYVYPDVYDRVHMCTLTYTTRYMYVPCHIRLGTYMYPVVYVWVHVCTYSEYIWWGRPILP